MALSCYSNWEAVDFLDHPNPDMGQFYESELDDALLSFSDSFPDIDQLLMGSLFESPTDLFLVDTNSNLLPSLSDPSVLSLPPHPSPVPDELEFYQFPKRPKNCGDLYYPSNILLDANNFYTKPVMEHTATSFSVSDFMVSLPTESPSMVGFSECNGEKKACSSAQSIAARERRKRISKKTQELGRLIPGGNKMNTAQMFEAAFKHVKFLQAQVGILGLMGSIQGCMVSQQVGEQLQVLLSSASVQEKLCGEGSCIVPMVMLETLVEDYEIKSSPLISRDLSRYIEPIGGSDGSDAQKTK